MFNHSVELRNKLANESHPGSRPLKGIMLENCHDDDGMHQSLGRISAVNSLK